MIGRLAARVAGRRAKWIVIAAWVLLVVASGPLQGLLEERSTNASSSFLPTAAESTKVGQLLRDGEVFEGGEQVPAIVVFQHADADQELSSQQQDAIEQWLTDVSSDPAIPSDAQLSSPLADGPMAAGLRSEDGSTMLALIGLPSPDTEQITEVIDLLRERADELEQDADVQVWASGPAGFANDAASAFSGIDGKLVLGTSILVLVLLLLIYRSPLVALVPLVAVIFAAALARAVLGIAIDPFDLIVSGQTSGIMLILIFGAGTDYCLLIVARFREELHRHADPHDAMRETVRHTTPAILSSGSTVILAMLVLLFADLRSTSSLGPALIIGVTISMAAGLTLLPALLLALGRRSFWPFIPCHDEAARTHSRAWSGLAASIARRPVPWLVTVTLVLLACGAGLLTQQNQPTSDLDLFLDKPESVLGIEAIQDKLPAGGLAQGTVLVGTENPAALQTAVERVTQTLRRSDAVAQAFPSVTGTTDERTWQQIGFVLKDNPYGQQAVDAIEPLREQLDEVSLDAEVLVGGPTAETADTQTTNRHDLRIIVPGVLAMIALVLVILLRALVAPLLLVVTVVLGYAATIGICWVLFLGVLGHPGIDPGTLTFIFLFTAALGIDYNIFLVARIREEVDRGGDTVTATRDALAATGGVITSAGVILAGTFLILAALPLLPLRQLGIAVAIGVLLDTVLVRAMVVPAMLTLLREKSWWPARTR